LPPTAAAMSPRPRSGRGDRVAFRHANDPGTPLVAGVRAPAGKRMAWEQDTRRSASGRALAPRSPEGRSAGPIHTRVMWERFTERARRAIVFAQEEAAGRGGSYVEPEHLLLG